MLRILDVRMDTCKGVDVSRSKIHTKYSDSDGLVPSATTVLGIIAKPQLIHAAWELGTEGKDYRVEWGGKAAIGTIVHKMILNHLKNQREESFREYSRDEIEQAETCFIKYLEWEKNNPFTPIKVEQSMVSKHYRYGGTPDLVCIMNGQYTLIDFKSGKAGKNGSGIYDEMGYQLAAYDRMLIEEGIICKKWMIVRIGRDEKEGFEVKSFDVIEDYWDVFRDALNLYHSIQKCKGR
jgi:hypothetical protein